MKEHQDNPADQQADDAVAAQPENETFEAEAAEMAAEAVLDWLEA